MNWYILIHRSYLCLEAFSQLDRLYVNGSVDIHVFTDRRCYLQTWPMNMILPKIQPCFAVRFVFAVEHGVLLLFGDEMSTGYMADLSQYVTVLSRPRSFIA
ncbi:general transcription factor 3C polypeptide 2 [Trichinella spiralis]|uniref:general transcription factor 3C polypeptide 2 n=1 Tax=Trichinella spiralis TaxID=6334 RepID=UPI0001EFD4FD|nr:hypothetical protein Tsp_15726 [Trichinella spiralis]XP_003373804.1 general transcription factor 3C polypeptide 2 [Trichinella spiralis]